MPSCLFVDIRKISISLDANISKLGDVFSLDVAKLDGIEVSTSLYGRYICPIISDYGSHLQVSCGIVCSLSDVFYLVVSPDIVWLTEDNNFTGVFDVVSNVQWTVISDIAADDAIITYLHNADDISNTTMVSNIAISEYTHISNQLEFSNEVLIRNGEITIMTMFGNQDKVSNKSNIKNA